MAGEQFHDANRELIAEEVTLKNCCKNISHCREGWTEVLHTELQIYILTDINS